MKPIKQITERPDSVVFFGTGPLAAQSLLGLAENFQIELVITKPRPADFRGNWPVAELAEKLGLPIAYAADKSQVEQAVKSRSLTSKAGVVIDFGLLISAATIEAFPRGIINSHFSLLPRWRGADPITFAILSGDGKTGVSLMSIVEKMDAGPLIAQQAITLDKTINNPCLSQNLIKLSDQLLAENLPKYLAGQIEPVDQPLSGVTYSRKLQKSDGLIDWTKSAEAIGQEIRAFAGWPRSRTKLSTVELIITQAEVANETGKPGQYKIDGVELIIFCGQKALKIIELQPAGKKTMPTSEFLRGYQQKL